MRCRCCRHDWLNRPDRLTGGYSRATRVGKAPEGSPRGFFGNISAQFQKNLLTPGATCAPNGDVLIRIVRYAP